MSTRQYQSYADLAIEREAINEKLKYARKQFTTLIRETGTALRKQFIPDERTPVVKTSIQAIATRTIEWSEGTTATGAMEVSVQSLNHTLESEDRQLVKDWLLSRHWSVRQSISGGSHYHTFICI